MPKKMTKTQQRMASLKQKFVDKSFVESPEIDPEVRDAIEAGLIYEKVLGEYAHRPALRYFKKLGVNGIPAIIIGHMKVAVSNAEELGMDIETYVRAQFYWFHVWFKRAPKISEMVSRKGKFPSTKRATEYLKVSGAKKRVIFSQVLPSLEITSKKLDQINYERLEQLSTTWEKSKEEIMAMFASTGVFDHKWLNKNAIYLELKKTGKIQ